MNIKYNNKIKNNNLWNNIYIYIHTHTRQLPCLVNADVVASSTTTFSKEGRDSTDSEEDTRTANFMITGFLVGASLERASMVCGLIT